MLRTLLVGNILVAWFHSRDDAQIIYHLFTCFFVQPENVTSATLGDLNSRTVWVAEPVSQEQDLTVRVVFVSKFCKLAFNVSTLICFYIRISDECMLIFATTFSFSCIYYLLNVICSLDFSSRFNLYLTLVQFIDTP